MNEIKISNCGTIKLNSFHPLCSTNIGIAAIHEYKLPPFIDGSCRREPDFENPFPTITALCRQGSFAPHLKKNDIIVYITIGGKKKPYKKGHHLVAILQVQKIYENHEIAENEYLNDNLPIPSNCMVSNNSPCNFNKTAGNFKNVSQQNEFLLKKNEKKIKIGKRRVELWNEEYLKKSKKWNCFIKTKTIYMNVNNPFHITKSNFEFIFNKTPNTRTPNKITKKQLIEIGKLVNLKIII